MYISKKKTYVLTLNEEKPSEYDTIISTFWPELINKCTIRKIGKMRKVEESRVTYLLGTQSSIVTVDGRNNSRVHPLNNSHNKYCVHLTGQFKFR